MDTTLIHSVRIFDGESLICEHGYILLRKDKIEYVSKTPSTLPTADITINGEGKTALPGLIDAHVHVIAGVEGGELKQALRFGVTTVLDMFGDPGTLMELRRECNWNMGIADFRGSGYAAIVEGGWPEPVVRATIPPEIANEKIRHWPKLKGPEDAEEFVKERIKQGSSYIKLMHESGISVNGGPFPVPSLALQSAVVKAAHSHGLITLAHALSQRDTFAILEAGTDALAHCFCNEKPNAELLKVYKRNNSFLIPTLITVASLTGEEMEVSEAFAGHELSGRVLGDDGKKCYCQRMMMAMKGCSVEYAYETVRMLKKGGVDIVAGTDAATGLSGTAFGLSLHQELSLYTSRCQFTPAEALRSATVATARRFNMLDRGRIVEGLRADVLMVRGDPTVDIGCTMNIEGVWRGGQALKL